MNENCILAIIVVIAVFLSVPFVVGRSSANTSTSEKTKTGYMIRANGRNKVYGNGYPIFVDQQAFDKAMRTGEYTYDVSDTETRSIPVDIQYKDERLN
jgi:hypothetical protein